MGGFLAGFGESLNQAADLQQRAKFAQQQELMRANLRVAELLLSSTDPDDHAKALAIFADPLSPFRTDKDHPKIKEGRNILKTLGAGKAGQEAVTSGMPGMAGMLGPENSPFANMYVPGEGGPDQYLPPPEPLPPLPPLPAAQTTAPPATQGGQIAPQAAQGGPPSPQAGPPPPQVAGPPPMAGPPPPPPGMPPPMPASPPESPPIFQALAQEEARLQAAPPRLFGSAADAWRAVNLSQGDRFNRARLAAMAGEHDMATAILAGKEGVQYGVAGMREEGRTEDRALRKEIEEERLKVRKTEGEARVALAQARLKQDWGKHLNNLGVARERLTKADTPGTRAEERRLAKLQTQAEKAMDGASEGIAGVENLRTQFRLYTDIPFGITTALDKKRAWDRYHRAVSSEAQRMARAMMAMTLPGQRGATEARVKAMEKELADLWTAASEDEGNYRLDNIEKLMRATESELLGNIEKLAAKAPRAGESPLPERRPEKDLSYIETGPGTKGQGTSAAGGPPAPPPGLGGGKVVTRDKLAKYAAQAGVSIEEAEKRFKAKGYMVQ